MSNNLDTFSVEFKRDCLAFFLNDGLAAKTAMTKLPDDFFDFDPEFAIIFRAFKEFIEKYQDRPSRHALIDYITDWCNKTQLDEQKLKSVLRALNDAWDWDDYTPSYVRQKLYDAIRSHEVLKVARQIDTFVDDGKFDDLVLAMARARSCVDEDSEALEYWADSKDRMRRLEKRPSQAIPTGMAPVDDLLNGGLPRGALGMIMGGSGRGKTAILGQLALKASLQGYTTAYITLEADADEIMKRCDAHNAGMVLKDIPLAKMSKKLYKKIYEAYTNSQQRPGPFFVQYYPTKTIGVHQVDEFVTKLREERGKALDLLVVDYFDLLKMSGNYSKRYEALEENIEILRGIAGKHGFACWTASQINRGGLDKETVDMDDIAAGYGKVFPLDLLITISQTKEERAQNILRFFFAKNRQGPGGAVVHVEADFERMRFNALTADEANSRGLTSKKKKGPYKAPAGPTTSYGQQGP